MASQSHELAVANRILVHRGVLDAYGHVSVRDANDPDHFMLARNMAPGSVTSADIQRYDLDGNTVDSERSYLERFIHAEVYRSRPDVMAVVHSHSASVIPFSISRHPLRAVSHMAGFLGDQVPVFEIRDIAGESSDLLITDSVQGRALATALGDASVVLMRGHGCVVAGASLQIAVHRAVYTELNARVQWQAALLGGYTPLTPGEGRSAAAANDTQVGRAWDVWLQELG